MVPVARGPLRELEEPLDEEDARVADLAGALVLLGVQVEAPLEHVLVPLAVGEPRAERRRQVQLSPSLIQQQTYLVHRITYMQ